MSGEMQVAVVAVCFVFAPVYWWRLAQNVRRIRRARADAASEPACQP